MSSKINIVIEELNVLTRICEKCGEYEYLDLLFDNIQEWIEEGYDILSLHDLEIIIDETNK